MTLNTWQSVEMHRNSGDILKHETKDITYKNPESSIGRSNRGYCTPMGTMPYTNMYMINSMM